MERVVLDLSKPLQVKAPGGKVRFVVKDVNHNGLPVSLVLFALRAKSKVIVRLAGGCAKQSDADRLEMLEFFQEGFDGFTGVAFSGGTRELGSNGEVNPMVCDAAGAIAAVNEGSIAIGSFPRTGNMTLQGESSLVLDETGTRPNPGYSYLLMVQDGPDKALGWDGDIPDYFTAMTALQKESGFKVGMVIWNGGGVTMKEAVKALSYDYNWPVIVVKGSGRTADDIAKKAENKEGDFKNAIIVNRGEPKTLRTFLVRNGLIFDSLEIERKSQLREF